MRGCTLLFVMLTCLVAEGGRAEVADLAPPAANAPFDDVDEVTLQAEVTQQVMTFIQTLQRHWGESPDRLRTVVRDGVEREEGSSLIYLRNLHDHGVLEGYEFRKGSLARGHYVMVQRPLNGLNEFIGYYNALKAAFTAAYGAPHQDHVIWDNDLYAPLPDYWGVAVMIGHLRYRAVWETTDGSLVLDLSGDRHSRVSVEYFVGRDAAET